MWTPLRSPARSHRASRPAPCRSTVVCPSAVLAERARPLNASRRLSVKKPGKLVKTSFIVTVQKSAGGVTTWAGRPQHLAERQWEAWRLQRSDLLELATAERSRSQTEPSRVPRRQ